MTTLPAYYVIDASGAFVVNPILLPLIPPYLTGPPASATPVAGIVDGNEYLGLVTPWQSTKPKFTAELALGVGNYVDIQNVTFSFIQDYDLDQAIGAQLDAIGVRINRSRQLLLPLTGVYFSLDVAGLGFDQGTWYAPFDPLEGLVTLSDAQYRLYLRSHIIANDWNGAFNTVTDSLVPYFGPIGSGPTYISITDNYDMTMTMGITGTLPDSVTLGLLSTGQIGVRPMGVLLNVRIGSGGPLFGFDVENSLIAGFDVGTWSWSIS